MQFTRTRLLVVFVTVCGALLIVPPTAARAQSAEPTGTGLNCWVSLAGQTDGIQRGESASMVLKCTTSSPMPTAFANMLAAGCSGGAIYLSIRAIYDDGTKTSLTEATACNGAPPGSIVGGIGIGVAHGNLQHDGGTISGNTEGYPANTFALTWSFTFCPGCVASPRYIVDTEYVTFDPTYPVEFRSVGFSPGFLWSAGLATEPCGVDADCTLFYEGWPEPYPGGEGWPDPICEGFGVDWNPDDDIQLAVGDRQRVTITAPYGQWDEVTLQYSWTWGYDPLNGWGETSEPAVYQAPVIEEQTATTITLASAPVGSPRWNTEFHVRCNPDDPLQDNVYYRRAYGDLSTSIGPSRRACYFLRFELDGPASGTWDTVREGRAWVEEDSRYDDSGGITALAYGWRPTDGVRVTEAFTYTGTPPPWTTSPAEVELSVDSSGFTGPTSGHQSIKCTDSVGDIWIGAVFALPTNVGGTGGSGDGITEGGSGGVGGEGTPPGGTSPSGDPLPGAVGGVGPGAIGDGPGTGASCFEDVGWSLINPASWVTGGIKVGFCYLRAAVFPDTDVVKAEYERLELIVASHAPFSWFYAGLSMVTGFAGALPGAIAAHAGDCYTYGPAGADGTAAFSAVPELKVCPAASMASSGWDEFRPWMGTSVWVTWAIGVMMAAGKLWGMGATESYYLANEFNPGGV